MTVMAPAPGTCGLTLEMPCGTDDPAPDEVGHVVTVRADWSVTMPHDLDSERIAGAFGAATPCLDLAAGIGSALRHILEVVSRASGGLVDTRWCSHGRCHGVHAHDCDESAYRHELTPRHITARFGLRVWQAERLLAATREVWSGVGDVALVEQGRDGYRTLWDAAVHPDTVARLAAALPPQLLPMPALFYVDLAYSGIDPDWLHGVLGLFPDRELAQFLATRPHEHRLPSLEEVTELHALGLRADDLGTAIAMRTSVASIRADLEEGRSDPFILLAWQTEWRRVGCSVHQAHFSLLADHGMPHLLPEAAAIDATLALCQLADDAIGRTEVGVMLALLGEPIRVAEAVSHGVSDPLDPRLMPIATRGETR